MHTTPGPLDDVFNKLVDTPPEDREVPCRFITGRAGTGKTFEMIRRVNEDPSYGLLTAVTGIAAVNLGAITLHSTLRYFNTESMRDAYLSGRLARTLSSLAQQYRWLIIDEASMMEGEQLDLLYRGMQEANRYAGVTKPMGILLVADFAQLPPVKGKWVFESEHWDKFAASTTILEKVWRQDAGEFLDALNLVRRGEGRAAAQMLTDAGIEWHSQRDSDFPGTTIVPVNQSVSRHNIDVLDRMPGTRFIVTSQRWGQLRSEWGENSKTHEWGIPPKAEFKLGAYVMLLANAKDFEYVNGDCGTIVEHSEDAIHIELVRTKKVVAISKLVRGTEFSERPNDFDGPRIPKNEDFGEWLPQPHFRGGVRRYVLGQIEYFPIRLAFASSVHKSQSLTLDKVQMDYRHWFFGKPAMLYTGLSRCRTLEGLRLVGTREQFAKQCSVHYKVRPWL